MCVSKTKSRETERERLTIDVNELFLLIDLSCHCGSTACLGRIKGARHLSDSILSKLSRFPFFSDLIKLMNFFWKVFKKKQKKTWDVFLSLTISDSFFNLQILYQSTHSGDERIWKEALEAHQFLEAVYHAEMGDSDTWNFKKLGGFFFHSRLSSNPIIISLILLYFLNCIHSQFA